MIGKISAFLMALLVLFSTFSFTVEKHLCMGKVASVSVIGAMERCEMPQNSDHNTNELTVKKKSCCQDVIKVIERTNSELLIVKAYDTQKIELAAVFLHSYLTTFEGLIESTIPFRTYAPPNIIKDLQVVYDIYLI